MFKDNYHQILVGIFAVIWAGICFYVIGDSIFHKNREVVYDCRLSEISPDFPIEAREQCRKMRAASGRI